MGLRKLSEITDDQMNVINDFFSNLDLKVLNYEAAFKVGELSATILKGQTIGWRDIFIAAIVCINGKTIITGNAEHFKRIPEIKVIEYY